MHSGRVGQKEARDVSWILNIQTTKKRQLPSKIALMTDRTFSLKNNECAQNMTTRCGQHASSSAM